MPVTSNTKHVHPFQVLLPARQCKLPRTSKAQAEQIRPVSIERVSGEVGHLPAAVLAQLDAAIRLHLGL